MPNIDPQNAPRRRLGPSAIHAVAGMPYMIASAAIFAAVWALIRHASDSLDTLQIVFFRQLIGMLAVLPLLWQGGFNLLRTHRMGGHFVRAIAGVIAAYMTFYAISLIPLADVVAVGYAAPLFTTLAAAVFLGETLRLRRIVAVGIGFLGMLLVLRPGSNAMAWGHFLALGASVFVAVAMIMIRSLTRTEHPRTIVFYSFFLALPVSFIAVLPVWTWPDLEGLMMLLAIGFGAFVSQMLLVRAFALSEASALMPFDFLRLIIAAALGYFLFDERIDAYTLAGALVILAATIYLAHREGRALS